MEWLVLLLGGAVAAFLFWGRNTKSRTGKEAASAKPAFAKIRGNGKYSVEVVGESFYADAFERVLGSVAGSEDELSCDALLVFEDDNVHDRQAVGVYIQGHKVGHLSKTMAKEFRGAVSRDGIGKRPEFAVGARVYAGGSDRMFSVQLDLPET